MREVESRGEWLEWASERLGELEYYDRELPRMDVLEEEGFLAFASGLDISSTQEIRKILKGEARWENREENEAEAVFIVYDLPIDYSQAMDEYIEERGRKPVVSVPAQIVDEELVSQYRGL
ncbi:MAG: hypothetical protein ABEJ75_00675 [Candidatus Nanohaloarchaea archaeon]